LATPQNPHFETLKQSGSPWECSFGIPRGFLRGGYTLPREDKYFLPYSSMEGVPLTNLIIDAFKKFIHKRR
jgi:hypothetical protein